MRKITLFLLLLLCLELCWVAPTSSGAAAPLAAFKSVPGAVQGRLLRRRRLHVSFFVAPPAQMCEPVEATEPVIVTPVDPPVAPPTDTPPCVDGVCPLPPMNGNPPCVDGVCPVTGGTAPQLDCSSGTCRIIPRISTPVMRPAAQYSAYAAVRPARRFRIFRFRR
jgi:hypothetical protein